MYEIALKDQSQNPIEILGINNDTKSVSRVLI